MLVHVGTLVVVAQQHGLVAQPRARRANALLRLGIGEYVEAVEADGGYLHDANPWSGGVRKNVRQVQPWCQGRPA